MEPLSRSSQFTSSVSVTVSMYKSSSKTLASESPPKTSTLELVLQAVAEWPARARGQNSASAAHCSGLQRTAASVRPFPVAAPAEPRPLRSAGCGLLLDFAGAAAAGGSAVNDVGFRCNFTPAFAPKLATTPRKFLGMELPDVGGLQRPFAGESSSLDSLSLVSPDEESRLRPASAAMESASAAKPRLFGESIFFCRNKLPTSAR
mmetsp:Transcript_8049/g.18010  ORF Transcript_8049/g.18010 Transcript_8049/m.18010 type:complete len:205 (-) Transcript_8049:633-1247(-)